MKCKTCGARGEIGILVDDECKNCRETRRTGRATVIVSPRSPTEIGNMVLRTGILSGVVFVD